MKLVIIGLGTAGFAAALTAKKTGRASSITIIDNKDFDLLHPCGLPFYLEGKIKSLDALKHDLGLKQMGIDKVKGKAINIDAKNKEVITENNEKIRYDKLIIAAGASPFMPPIEGKELAYTLHTDEDAEKISKIKEKKVAIIGASAIGLETAVALNKKGKDVTVIDMLPSAFPRAIDPDMSKILEGYLKKKGIKLLFNEKINRIEKNQAVILATGVKANKEIAENAGIKCSKNGIIVNDQLETSAKDAYAAGDCIETMSFITKKPFMAQIATAAYRQGMIAAANALGRNEKYDGALATFVSVIDELEVAATGFNTFFAESNGYKVSSVKGTGWLSGVKLLTANNRIIGSHGIGKEISGRINVISAAIKAGMGVEELNAIDFITEDKTVSVGKKGSISQRLKGSTKPDWFPGGKEITVELYADSNGKLTGAELTGQEGTAWRANVLLTAIKAGFTLKDLSNLELAYCPSVSQHYDVLIMAADLGLRKLKE